MSVHAVKPAQLLTEQADRLRLAVSKLLDPGQRSRMGQFFTPAPVARFMATLFEADRDEIRLLDAGAGIGSLTAAFVEETISRPHPPRTVHVTAYEMDPLVATHLRPMLDSCRAACEEAGVAFAADLREEDFIRAGAGMLGGRLFEAPALSFNCAILNPPYRKIHSDSQARRLLREAGIETSNLYTAFLALVVRLLAPGGELVAITPRSFCNGPYFKPFRKAFLRDMSLKRIHVFESREAAFRDDEVLQENVILHAVKGGERSRVKVSSSAGPRDFEGSAHEVDYDRVVCPDDAERFIRITVNGADERIAERMTLFRASLDDLGLSVSTGPVVDFRARRWLRDLPDQRTVPLIYPCHFDAGYVRWPRSDAKKPNAIVRVSRTENLLVPGGAYVLVKRFSAKEEPRRIVAAVFDPARIPSERVGIENHLNYFHARGKGLPLDMAKGLALYLNSSLVDAFFRQFSGHTQVNATDLRNMRYPTASQLAAMGGRLGGNFPSQTDIDRIVEEEAQT